MELDEAVNIVSYKIGLRFGETANTDSLFSKESILQAIQDKSDGTEREIDLKTYMQATKIVSAERSRRFKVANEDYLIANKSKQGVITTDSGLQYRVLQKGPGTIPSEGDIVTVHYTGRLIDGTIFDSSLEKGTPATFAVNKVIRGWAEALVLMNTGSKAELVIPQNIGYGERGLGSDIPPFATLVFEVELIQIESPVDR